MQDIPTYPSIRFAAKNVRFVSNAPDGPDKFWMADLKACREKVLCQVFKNIIFVESMGIVCIHGIQFPSGYPEDLMPDWAIRQQAFISFLRSETQRDNSAMGHLSVLFTGHEYRSECRATAAYIAARGTLQSMGVGYLDKSGEYITIHFEDDGWLEFAKLTPPFDELCQTE